jgi:ubiquinone/menaquinone biosynthesis C-methylase UbiE
VSDTRDDWTDYIVKEFSFLAFPHGSRVLDVGCGTGQQLVALRDAGFDAVGVEPTASLVHDLAARGLDVRHGVAEQLPIDDRSVDGVVCKVVLPYTDERRAIGEWARVLRPGGRVRASYHGSGYYLRCLLDGPGPALRVYATRSFVNTWWYAATGTRLPRFVGDTIYQSPKRLVEYYRRFGFSLDRVWPAPQYRGKPVFIYHELTRN